MRLYSTLCYSFILVSVLSTAAAFSQTRRAVVIGINTYLPKEEEEPVAKKHVVSHSSSVMRDRGTFKNLDGCTNDADAIASILQSRFDFSPENIHLLKDTMATRENIFGSIRKYLIDGAAVGDQVFFFYAGHGSQIRNSKSTEKDSMDETMVPADSYLGTPDIRDKEIRRIMFEIVKKGAILTAMFDCCHSGSITRGIPSQDKTRFIMPVYADSPDASDPGPAPADSGALIFSACHDYQLANEAHDERNTPHGAFTLALIKTLRNAPVNESADDIFKSVKANMQHQGSLQEPDLDGPQRRGKPLFGGSTKSSGNVKVAVLNVRSADAIEIQGGIALEINPGCELRKVGKSPADTSVRIRVTDVSGMSKAVCKVVRGKLASIATGDLFEIDKWAAPSNALLRVWMPPANLSYDNIRQVAASLEKLNGTSGIELIGDPTIESPTHTLLWNGTEWIVRDQTGADHSAGKNPDAKSVEKLLAGNAAVKLFLCLPPFKAMDQHLGLGAKPYDAIEVTKTMAQARYFLVGRRADNAIQYSWILPNMTEHDKDSVNESMPLRSDWLAGNAKSESQENNFIDTLRQYALTFGKISAWLSLENPVNENPYPYTLALRNPATKEMKTEGPLVEGEEYQLVLRARPGELKDAILPRYIYAFIIDEAGTSQLIFPASGTGNLENRLPVDPSKPESVIVLNNTKFSVSAPLGVDNYILVTSEEPIPNPDDLAFQGVREGLTRGAGSPLGDLLMQTGSPTRSINKKITTANWTINKLVLKSIAK